MKMSMSFEATASASSARTVALAASSVSRSAVTRLTSAKRWPPVYGSQLTRAMVPPLKQPSAAMPRIPVDNDGSQSPLAARQRLDCGGFPWVPELTALIYHLSTAGQVRGAGRLSGGPPGQYGGAPAAALK